MLDTVVNVAKTSLINIVCTTKVSTNSSNDNHFVFVSITTIWAFPNKLTVSVINSFDFSFISTNITMIALCIELCVHNVFVDALHNSKYTRNILLHVRNFYVADCSTWTKFLKLRFKLKLVERIDFFTNVYVIRVRNVIVVCYIWDDPKCFLKRFCKFVCC